MRKLILASVVAMLSTVPTLSQEGLATTSTIGGHNTIQQAPSGGTPGRATGAGAGAAGNNDQPTKEERETEKQNDAATTICKGC